MRHKILALSFVLVVIVPTLVSGWYLYTRAEDQYISTVAFTVRQKEGPSTIDVLGGLTQFTGGGGASDTDIIYDYLRSQDIVTKVDQQTDLRGKFSKAWPQDWVYAFDPEGTIEDLTEYWRKQVVVLYDVSTKLITVEVGAYTAADARDIAIAIFEESSRIINSLSDIAREDATKYAREELIQAQDRLTKARQALTEFRTKTQIVDPSADLAGQMGVLNALQTQLVEALISLDQLAGSAPPNDPRVVQSEKKVAAIRARIAQERAKFGSGGESPMGESYAELMSDYEGLAAQKEFAETTFISAQAAFVAALAEAQRQSRYLAAHIRPALAEASLKPDRPMTILSIFGFAFLGWSIMLLVYYSIRDRR
ncbi:MAG: capsule biosynthesis protein [Alphaproteobacteria bacterium]|nr:MAG: capsule biosynthesis protein [Alphaproteobacteria bacterium]